ncbi:hypothetical protein BH09GEM1_BH09GEM1_07220 [soil metagenome]
MTQPRFPRLVGWFVSRGTPGVSSATDAMPTPRWIDAALLLGVAAIGYGVMRAA